MSALESLEAEVDKLNAEVAYHLILRRHHTALLCTAEMRLAEQQALERYLDARQRHRALTS